MNKATGVLILATLATAVSIFALLSQRTGTSLPANFLVDVTMKGMSANQTADVWTGSFARNNGELSYSFTVVDDETTYTTAYANGALVQTSDDISFCATNMVAPAPIMSEEASDIAATNAVELSSSDVAILAATRGLTCNGGRVFQVDAFGMTYAVCMINGKPASIHGAEFVATLSNWRSGSVSVAVPADCGAMASNERRMLEQAALESHDMSAVNEFWWRPSAEDREAASKDCGFVHGLNGSSGGWNKKSKGSQGVNWRTNKCKTRLIIDWPGKTWYWKSSTHRTSIANNFTNHDIIFAHSMGNVMLINACQLSSTCRGWYDIQGPVTGSEAADFAEWTCSNGGVGAAATIAVILIAAGGPIGAVAAAAGAAAIISCILWMVAHLSGQCKNAWDANDTCRSLRTCQMRSKTYTSSVRGNVKSSTCGTSGWGLSTTASPQLFLVGGLAGLPGHDDGAVPYWYSCRPATGYSHSDGKYKKRYYKASVNHKDGKSIHGNGWWGKHRQPASWINYWDNYDSN